MLCITNKMQHNTIFIIAVKALHVSGSFPAHHQELKNCTYSIWYLSSLTAATASVVEMEQVPSQPCKQMERVPSQTCKQMEQVPSQPCKQ
jgi:hypothetical protein